MDLYRTIPSNRKVVLYGAGAIGASLLPIWAQDERFVGFCSRTKVKQKNGFCGFPVMSPEELLAKKDMSVIISAGNSVDEIMQILKNGGYPENQVYTLNNYGPMVDRGQYFAPDFMVYDEEEVFIDDGCYDLSSSLELKKYCRHVKKVYAFEPDPDNYTICAEKKRGMAAKKWCFCRMEHGVNRQHFTFRWGELALA